MELSFFHTATAILAMALSFASAAPVAPIGLIGPVGPCPEAKVDAILNGKMDPAECCSYGRCKGDVVVSVG